MHLLFSSAPAMASTMKLFILLLICYVAFGYEQMPYWQIEEEIETVNPLQAAKFFLNFDLRFLGYVHMYQTATI